MYQCIYTRVFPVRGDYLPHTRKSAYTLVGIVCTRVSGHPIQNISEGLQNHEKPIKTHDWGLWFHVKIVKFFGCSPHWAGSSHVLGPLTTVTGMQVSAALKNRPYYGRTLTAPLMLGNGARDGGVNHGMAGGIHTTQIEGNSLIHLPYCALWLARAVTWIYRLHVWVEAESTFLFSPNTMVCSGRVTDSLSLWPKQLQVSCHFRGCQASCPFIRHLSCHKDVCFLVWFFSVLWLIVAAPEDFQLPGSTAVSLYCSNPSGWCWKQLLAMYRKWSNCQLPCPHSKSSDFNGSWQRLLLNLVAEVIAQKAPAESVKSIQVQIFEANLLKRWCLFGGHKE